MKNCKIIYMKVDNLYIIKAVQSLFYRDYCTNGSLKKFYNSIHDLSSVYLWYLL